MAVRFPETPQPLEIFGNEFENSLDRMIDYNTISHLTQVGGEGKNPGELSWPNGVAIDDNNNNIYVTELDTARVSIFSESCEFLNSFTQQHMEQPHGIAIHRNNVYVSDTEANGVFRFKIETNICFSAVLLGQGSDDGKFNFPHQLSVSDNGEVFVADYINHRVQILDESLHFQRSIKHDSMIGPLDVKLTNNEVFVLTRSSPCVIVFSHAREILRSLITRGKGMQVRDPLHFCIDTQQNLIFSDDGANFVKIFSPDASLIHCIKVCSESYTGQRGIAITKQSKIFNIAPYDSLKLQIYSC